MVIRASDSRAAWNDNLWQIYDYRRKSLPVQSVRAYIVRPIVLCWEERGRRRKITRRGPFVELVEGILRSKPWDTSLRISASLLHHCEIVKKANCIREDKAHAANFSRRRYTICHLSVARTIECKGDSSCERRFIPHLNLRRPRGPAFRFF